MIISWIKLDINILDDAKIKIIRSHPDGDKVVVLWIGLLCLAMKSSRPGIIEISDGLPYTVDDLSNLFAIEKKTVEMGLALFAKYRMIDIMDGTAIEIINFAKHQSLEQLEHKRELTRLRQIEFRKRNRNAGVTRYGVTGDATEKNRIDKRRDTMGPLPQDEIPYQEIISYLNEKTGKKFDHRAKETRAKIKARWGVNGSSRTLQDFKTVIDVKCAQWLPDEKMISFLRPETLFGTKFESYLNEVAVRPRGSSW